MSEPIMLVHSNFRATAKAAIKLYQDNGLIIEALLWSRIIAYYEAELGLLSPRPRVSRSQRYVLENMFGGKPWNAHARGQSQHGGLTATLSSLVKLKYVRYYRSGPRLTKLGRATYLKIVSTG